MNKVGLTTLLDKVPLNSRVAVYGTNHVAKFIKTSILENRKDLIFNGFIYTHEKHPDLDGYKVYTIEDLNDLSKNTDVVIIASFSNAEIMKFIISVFKFQICLAVSKEDFDYCISNEISKNTILPMSSYTDKEKRVIDILETEEDKDLYKKIITARRTDNWVSIQAYMAKHNKEYWPIGYYKNEYFEYINKDAIKTVFDCGAHECAQSIISLSVFNNIEKVYAFEPIYEYCKSEFLDRLVQANKDRLELVDFALWDKKSTLEMQVSTILGGSRLCEAEVLIDDLITTTLDVNTISIDELVKEKDIQKVDFIKMDIEGSELRALKGGFETIKRDRPQLAICIYHMPEDIVDIPIWLYENLKNYKFRLGHYSNMYTETVLYAIPEELYNK